MAWNEVVLTRSGKRLLCRVDTRKSMRKGRSRRAPRARAGGRRGRAALAGFAPASAALPRRPPARARGARRERPLRMLFRVSTRHKSLFPLLVSTTSFHAITPPHGCA